MDFKVTGTENGITALQMDMKVHGLPTSVLAMALEQGKQGRAHILQHMISVISTPGEMSPYAPRVESIKINPDKIREVIGKGGETIQDMQKYFGVEISIEDDGTVVITGPSKEAGEGAKKAIENIVREIEIGQEFDGEVVKILEGVGAIVEIGGGKSGMIHISKLSDKRVERVEDVVNTGDKVHVKVIQVDNEKGRIGLQKI